MKLQRLIILGAVAVLLFVGILNSGIISTLIPDISERFRIPDRASKEKIQNQSTGSLRVVTEESVVIDAVEKASPSVVTIGITKTSRVGDIFEINPFDPFSPFRTRPGREQTLEQDIGSGFVVSQDGLIVTNKHVVSDTEAKYRVILKDDTSYDVQKIFRDPVNDLAILKINASGVDPIALGDSSGIKVGQMAIAIGTALGEFRSTVTVGVISGVGRGITAGSPFEGYVERLDNVIQTDAAINPGNSGGPLLNSSGQVIGVNTAVSSEGQNIGFAIPINVVKDAIDNFNRTGQFNRPYLGVRYKVIGKDLAILNDIPEGAYIIEVVEGSPAEKAGLRVGDIIIKIGDTRLSGDNEELSSIIGKSKPGDSIKITLWREGKNEAITVILGSQDQ
jgi:S1-C subfamily serine protease